MLLGGDLQYAVQNLAVRVTDLQYQLQAVNQRAGEFPNYEKMHCQISSISL